MQVHISAVCSLRSDNVLAHSIFVSRLCVVRQMISGTLDRKNAHNAPHCALRRVDRALQSPEQITTGTPCQPVLSCESNIIYTCLSHDPLQFSVITPALRLMASKYAMHALDNVRIHTKVP